VKKKYFFFFHDVRLINKQLFSGCKHTVIFEIDQLFLTKILIFN
jgi:hypothetical protein